MTLKLGSGRRIELDVDAEDGLLNDYVRSHILWSSSDESVVSVADDGTLTVHAVGEAVVTASFGQSSVSVRVTVGEDETAEAGGGGAGAGTGTEAAPSAPTPAEPAPAAPQTAPAAPPEDAPPEDLPETGAEIELPPPEEPPVELIRTQQVFTIRPELLAGLLKTAPEAAAESGGAMQEDSAQLVVPPPETPTRETVIALSTAAAFALGFFLEFLRFQRLKQR